jgi:hypothetical protein
VGGEGGEERKEEGRVTWSSVIASVSFVFVHVVVKMVAVFDFIFLSYYTVCFKF